MNNKIAILLLIITLTIAVIYKPIIAIPLLIITIALLIKSNKEHQQELGAGEYGPVRVEIKRAVRKRQNNKCAWPNCQETKHLELHHIIPQKNGGDNRVSNLTYLCPNHHAQSHDINGKTTYNKTPTYLRGTIK